MAAGELVVSIIGDMKELSRVFSQVQTEVGKVGKQFETMGKSLSSAGTSMAAGITAPILAIAGTGALLVNWANDVGKSQGQVKASLGLTAEEANKLTDAAINVWERGFGDSIDSVNQVIVSVRQNMGDLAGNELESVAAGAITISNIFGEDVNEITAAAGVLMKNFGIDGEHALDLITTGYQQGGDFSKELLDTLREYAPQFKAMGINADEFLSILISGAQAGAWNLDKVADAVKEFNIRAQDGSDLTAEGFAAIGLNADEMAQKIAAGGDTAKEAFMATVAGLMAIEDPVERNIAGVALFGTQWEDVKAQVIDATASGIQNVKDVAGATDKAAKDVADSNPMRELTKAARDLQADLLPIIQEQIIPLITQDLLPILTGTLIPFIKNVALPAISAFVEGFAALPEPLQLGAIALTAFVTALGPILIVTGAVVSSVGTLAAAFGTGGALAGAISFVSATLLPALSTAFGIVAYTVIPILIEALGLLISPIGLVIVAVAALALAWKNNWFDIQGKAQVVWSWIKTQANDLKNQLERAWHAIVMSVSTLKTQFGAAWDALKAGFTTIAGMLVSAAMGLYNGMVSAYNSMIASLTNFKTQMLTRWAEIRTGVYTKLTELINDAQTWLNNQQTKFNTAISQITDLKTRAIARWTELKSGILNKLNEIISDIQNWINRQNDKFSKAVASVNDLKTRVIKAFSDMLSEIRTKINEIINAIKELPAKVKALGTEAYNAGKAFVQKLIDGLKSKLQEVKNTVSEITKLSSISESSAAKSVKSAGSSVVDTIKSAGTKAKVSLTEAAQGLRRLLPSSPAKEGPFKKLPNWDAVFVDPLEESIQTAKGFTAPLKSTLSSLRSPLDSMAGGLKHVSNVSTSSTNYEGSTYSIGPNYVRNDSDLQAIISAVKSSIANDRRRKGIFS